MANLASGFRDAGCAVRLLTARWDARWPQAIACRDVPVFRLPQPQHRLWGTLRYMRALARWLKRHEGTYDLVYVSMLKHDAYAALGAVGRRVPVVLRAEGGGTSGDCAWHRTAVGGRWIARRCRRAPALVAPSPGIAEELVDAGFSADRVQFLPNGVAIPPLRTPEAKVAARLAVGKANVQLRIDPLDRLAVYTGRLHAGKGLCELIDAWALLDRQHAAPWLWLAGEGPLEDELHRRIAAANLSGRVTLAGTFDHVDDILAAADAFVFPSHEEGMSLALLEAMAAGLPIVATDIPGNRLLLRHQKNALLVPVGDPQGLAAAVGQVFADTLLAERLAAAARHQAAAEYSLEATTQRHLQLFTELLSS